MVFGSPPNLDRDSGPVFSALLASSRLGQRRPKRGSQQEQNRQDLDLAPSFAHEPQDAFPHPEGSRRDSILRHPCQKMTYMPADPFRSGAQTGARADEKK
jgi:hypothetical protein